MNSKLLNRAGAMSVSDQIELVEAFWDAIAKRNLIPQPTTKQSAELDRRIADLDARPVDTVAWNEARTEALNRIGR